MLPAREGLQQPEAQIISGCASSALRRPASPHSRPLPPSEVFAAATPTPRAAVAAADRAFEDKFGPRAALEAKYAVASANAEALKVEESSVCCRLRSAPGRSIDFGLDALGDERHGIGDYVKEQVVRALPCCAATAGGRRGRSRPCVAPCCALGTRGISCDGRGAALGLRSSRGLRGAARTECPWAHPDTASPDRRRTRKRGPRRSRQGGPCPGGVVEAEPRACRLITKLIAIAVARYEAGLDVPVPAEALDAPRCRERFPRRLVCPRTTRGGRLRRHRLLLEGVGWWAHNLVSLLEEPGERLAC